MTARCFTSSVLFVIFYCQCVLPAGCRFVLSTAQLCLPILTQFFLGGEGEIMVIDSVVCGFGYGRQQTQQQMTHSSLKGVCSKTWNQKISPVSKITKIIRRFHVQCFLHWAFTMCCFTDVCCKVDPWKVSREQMISGRVAQWLLMQQEAACGRTRTSSITVCVDGGYPVYHNL